MPLNWNDEHIPSKADKTTDILGLKEIGGVGQLVYHPFKFKDYTYSFNRKELLILKTRLYNQRNRYGNNR